MVFSPEGLVNVRLGFSSSNNLEEYEALLAGLRSAKILKVKKLRIHCDIKTVC